MASIPALVTPQPRSQSARASSSLRVVPNERVSCWRPPARVSLGTRMVTSIPALAMSIPATRSANSGSSSTSCIGSSYDEKAVTGVAVRGSCGQAEIWSAGSKRHVTALENSSQRSDSYAGSSPPRSNDVSGRPPSILPAATIPARPVPRLRSPHLTTTRAARQSDPSHDGGSAWQIFTPLPRHPGPPDDLYGLGTAPPAPRWARAHTAALGTGHTAALCGECGPGPR